MKIKNTLLILLCTLGLVIALTACELFPKEVSRNAVDKRFTASHQQIENYSSYEYDLLAGKFRLMPKQRLITVPDKYEIAYEIIYSDDSKDVIWVDATKDNYDAFIKK